MSDFARPPKKPPRAGKGTFGQTNGLHPLAERRMYDRIIYKKAEEKKKKKLKMLNGEILALERLWRLPCISVSARRFQISKNRINRFLSVVRCMDANERQDFRRRASDREVTTQTYQKETFDAETKPPHSNNVQHSNSKSSMEITES